MLLGLVVGGCATTTSPSADAIQGLFATAGTGISKDLIPRQPDPRFTYLRVQVQGHPPGLLVLGYVEVHPLGPVEVWYSGRGETVRLQNGRVVGSTGTLRSWAGVHFEPPPVAWSAVGPQGVSYERQHDEMPGYRFGIRERVQLSAWQGLPPLDLPDTLPLATAQGYQWFREAATPLNGQGAAALPDAWFALGQRGGKPAIVYSEQCLAPDFCMKLQRWPLVEVTK